MRANATGVMAARVTMAVKSAFGAKIGSRQRLGLIASVNGTERQRRSTQLRVTDRTLNIDAAGDSRLVDGIRVALVCTRLPQIRDPAAVRGGAPDGRSTRLLNKRIPSES